MKNRHWFILCCLMVAVMPPVAMAQQPYPIDTVDGTAVYRYTPEKSIGLYRISVRFGVPQDVIIQWNPQLQERGPQLGEILLIPVKQNKKERAAKAAVDTAAQVTPVPAVQEEAQPLPPVVQQPSDSVALTDTVPQERVQVADTVTADNSPLPGQVAADTLTEDIILPYDVLTEEGSVLKIGIMLPLRADAPSRDASDDRFFDFYAGALLAIRQAESAGQRIEVHLYDTDKGFRKIDQCLEDSFLHKADAIIGPVYPAQAEYMSETVLRDSVLMVVPFADDIPSITDNPFILQFNPSSAAEAEKLSDYILSLDNGVNCVFVDSAVVSHSSVVSHLRRSLSASDVRLSSVSIREILNDSLDVVLVDTLENILVFNTERYGSLQVLMPHIQSCSQGHVLTLLSHYSWQKESIPVGQLYASIFSSVGGNSDDLSSYEDAWQRYFGYSRTSLFPRYDLLGYDLTMHLVLMLQQLSDIADSAYRDTVLTRPYHGLQSVIRYKRSTEIGGYVNDGIQILTR